ncbi:MAG TPA: tetratricopeptide repeat protein [Candidatus Limnocylindria bacterium]|nr:tetratricopeptide repeat protein [Candidatus Limnocylindria bacterium]
MNRRLVPVLALSAAAFVAAVAAHPAGVAARGTPKAAASPTPSPAPSATATPEPLDHAIPRLEAAIKADPTDKSSQTELAADYVQINRPDLALPITQKLLQTGTKTAQVYYFDGLSQLALGHTPQATSDLENAANLEPTNAGVLGTLTNLYLQENRASDAERVAKRAMTFNQNDKNAHMAYGSVLATEGKYDQARGEFENAAKIDPKDVRPIMLEAQTYLGQNSIALASQLYDRALTIDPNNMEALVAKARMQASQHDVTGAIATYDKIFALQTDPADKVAVLDQEGAVYANEKMDAQADATFKKAIANYPNVFSAHTAYGEYLASKNDKAGAEREWITGAGPNRDQSDALARLGQLYASENQFPKAIEQFKRLTQVAGNDPRSHLLLAASYNADKQFSKARDEFKASYNLQHSPDALLGLGQADIATHNYAECAQVYDALDRGAPDLSRQNPSILYGLGQCYQHSNQPAKAKTAYQRLLSYVKPGSQAATQVKALIDSLDHSKPAAKPTQKKATDKKA